MILVKGIIYNTSFTTSVTEGAL